MSLQAKKDILIHSSYSIDYPSSHVDKDVPFLIANSFNKCRTNIENVIQIVYVLHVYSFDWIFIRQLFEFIFNVQYSTLSHSYASLSPSLSLSLDDYLISKCHKHVRSVWILRNIERIGESLK